MLKESDMQDVPAQFITLSFDGERRHPAWCRYAQGRGKSRICKSPQSPMYYKQCYSAAKCVCYEKKE